MKEEKLMRRREMKEVRRIITTSSQRIKRNSSTLKDGVILINPKALLSSNGCWRREMGDGAAIISCGEE